MLFFVYIFEFKSDNYGWSIETSQMGDHAGTFKKNIILVQNPN